MRNQSFTLVLTYINSQGHEVTDTFPSKKEVCDRCGGCGTHVNSSIDGNGITGSEWDDLGPEFQESYMAGHFDVRCEECHGANVVDVIDRAACTTPALERALVEYDAYKQAQWQAECEQAAERRAECGYYY